MGSAVPWINGAMQMEQRQWEPELELPVLCLVLWKSRGQSCLHGAESVASLQWGQ